MPPTDPTTDHDLLVDILHKLVDAQNRARNAWDRGETSESHLMLDTTVCLVLDSLKRHLSRSPNDARRAAIATARRLTAESVRAEERERAATVNVNDYMWVRLTRKGREMFRAYHEDLGFDPTPYIKMVDEDTTDGWTRFHLHEVMHLFGSQMFMGANPLPFEPAIRMAAPADAIRSGS